MVVQYPYTLWLKSAASATPDAQGNWSAPNQVWQSVSVCRDETNTGGQSIPVSGGTAYVYQATVYLPLTCPVIPTGSQIEIRQGNQLRLRGTVSGFSRDQFHSRLWV